MRNAGLDALQAGIKIARRKSIITDMEMMPKTDCSNNCTIALISHASNVRLKILQARLQQYMNQELPDVRFIKR